jgi:hypothetical protein
MAFLVRLHRGHAWGGREGGREGGGREGVVRGKEVGREGGREGGEGKDKGKGEAGTLCVLLLPLSGDGVSMTEDEVDLTDRQGGREDGREGGREGGKGREGVGRGG